MAGLLGIGLTGINASQASLYTTSHNITNANTQGYTRQETLLNAARPHYAGGSGFIGQGVDVGGVRRQYDQFLNQAVLNASARKEESAAYNALMRQVDNLLADESAGLSPAISDFFRGVNDVANNPASIPARQAMISLGESLVARFNSMNARLGEIGSINEGQIATTAEQINVYAKEIATINQRIAVVQAGGPSAPANDLHDQRNSLLAELNKLVKVNTFTDSSTGALNVFIGNGQSLVTGNTASRLVVTPTVGNPLRGQVSIAMPGGATLALSETQLGGGQLSGLLQFRSETLDRVRGELDTLAYEMATQVNAQHYEGLTLDGALGGDFFGDLRGLGSPAGAAGLIRVAINDPRQVAAASRAATGASTNQGSASVNLASAAGASFSLRFDAAGAQYEVFDRAGVSQGFIAYDPTDPATLANGVTAALPGSLSALSVTLNGVPGDGDRFTSSFGAGDNRNALALGGMQTAKLMNGGTATLQSAYSQTVSFVGNKSRQLQVAEKAQTAQLQQASDAQQALSGVNLDEEAANLIRFQQAYQASARVMSLAGTLFDEVLSMARR